MEARPSPPSPREKLWTNVFFYFSAVMGAFALVDLSTGRIAHAMGDGGVACLMIALMNQFPVVRAIVANGNKRMERDQLLREAENLRRVHPWSERAGGVGWVLLLGSLVLRAVGVS